MRTERSQPPGDLSRRHEAAANGHDNAPETTLPQTPETMTARRAFLTGLGATAFAAATRRTLAASAANQWYPVRSDDGQPVPNLRAPVELIDDLQDLPGVLWGGGGAAPAVTLVEFYDYNCPWCRRAAADLAGLMRDNRDLRVGLVNNPILSPGSMQAAKVHLAVQDLAGPRAAHDLHERLLAMPGRMDGPRALEAASAVGTERNAVERRADTEEVRLLLRRQMSLAASLGLQATPSFVVGGAAILGYPGSASLARIVSETRACGTITCQAGG